MLIQSQNWSTCYSFCTGRLRECWLPWPRAQEEILMTQASYKESCPLAVAAEILCTRWTLVLIREFIAGSTRFNDLCRGVPKMSPTLLSQRLKELEDAGVITLKLLSS